MHAILRRYEGVESSRSVELARNVDERFIRNLKELPGFSGYYLIEAGNGVMTSVNHPNFTNCLSRSRHSSGLNASSAHTTSTRNEPGLASAPVCRSPDTALA